MEIGVILCYDRKKLKGYLSGKDAIYKASIYEKSSVVLGYVLETSMLITVCDEQKNQGMDQSNDYPFVWANTDVNSFYPISLMLRFGTAFRCINPK